METPKNGRQQIRTIRNHTPKLSERKKKLFDTAKDGEDGDENELLNGIERLKTSKLRSGSNSPKNSKDIESLIGSLNKSPRVVSFFETESEDGDTGEEQKPSPSRRSVRLSLKKSPDPNYTSKEFSTSHKENIPVKTPTRKEVKEAKKLQKMFSNSMQITPRNKTNNINEDISSDDEEVKDISNLEITSVVNKRHCESEESTGLSPVRKIAKTTSPIDNMSISTKSFYSDKNKKLSNNTSVRPSCRNLFGQTLGGGSEQNFKLKQTPRRSLGSQSSSINRGVSHKVRKRTHTLGLGPKHYTSVDIDQILNNVRNDKLRKLITEQREEKQKIEKLHSIFRKASNPIAMARPLSAISNQDDANNIVENTHKQCPTSLKSPRPNCEDNIDFSDIECDAEVEENDYEQSNFENALMVMNEEVIPLITHQLDDATSVKSENSTAPIKKKFFKSGRTTTTRKEVHLTDSIKAIVTANGKLAIVSEKKKAKKRTKTQNSANEFSDEQATVDAILRNLDDSAFGDEAQNSNQIENDQTVLNDFNQELYLINDEESSSLIDNITPPDSQDTNEFRKRLPFNTTDPEIIERQHLLLDFLITNNICTEENFNIFIADPDNHKTEAEKIIDQLVVIVTDNQNTDFRQRIPYKTYDPEVIEQQHNFLDFLLENNICTENNFDIFIASYSQRKDEASAILSQYLSTLNGQHTGNANDIINNPDNNILIHENMNLNTIDAAKSLENLNNNCTTLDKPILQNALPVTTINSDVDVAENNVTSNTIMAAEAKNVFDAQNKLFPVFYSGGCQPLPQPSTRRKQQRFWSAGYGSNQYQIDAGQKAFGAHQCKQCGLVYTVHEPEEEKLHRDFHASLHILRFKGWIDEDIVAIYMDWGPDGRIIRLTESSPPKRHERLLDILKIVDKELGFSSYIVPKTFVAYFAVRKMQIVGLCLVQPLEKANKYICINGVDCCTEEQFEVKCGISRIWVSPLHRRFHIGSKLIHAVQLNTIFGEEIPINKIAFSAPTELGKLFAQKIAKTENFLIYQ